MYASIERHYLSRVSLQVLTKEVNTKLDSYLGGIEVCSDLGRASAGLLLVSVVKDRRCAFTMYSRELDR